MADRLRRKDRVCQACGVSCPLNSGPDPCLGMLPGTRNACCGHGNRRACMIQMDEEWVQQNMPILLVACEVQLTPTIRDGRRKVPTITLQGDNARDIQRALGGDPAPLNDEPLRGSGYLDGWPFKGGDVDARDDRDGPQRPAAGSARRIR